MLPLLGTGAGVVLQDGQFLVPQELSTAETSSARKQVDHLQGPEHHLGVVEKGVEEAEEPQRSDFDLLGLRKSLANNPE